MEVRIGNGPICLLFFVHVDYSVCSLGAHVKHWSDAFVNVDFIYHW